MMTVRALEDFLGRLLRAFRTTHVDPVRERLDVLSLASQYRMQAHERRLAELEQRIGGGVEAKVDRGAPVAGREWLAFVERLQRRELGAFDPARHGSWRGGQ